ncbi:nucleotide triphosphate diphosphatase NUDT15 [Actinoplanes xinjiangensis]|uniref:nucleotide triphosphate diphosphatase NUDT15 n=1 Tax=Actinoplanes xinjiangensis TaxID=512350 RepID=UPI00343123A4
MPDASPAALPLPERPVTGVGMLLLRPDDTVLLGRRVKHGEPVTWCLPGGHLEAGETFEQAAERETAEESGLTTANARAFGLALHLTGSGLVAGVVAAATGGTPEPLEPHVFERWEWHSLHHLPEPLFPASAVLLAMWRHEPTPPGWTTHHFAA